MDDKLLPEWLAARDRDRDAAIVEECAEVVHSYAAAFPEDVFLEPPPGEHGKTIDSCHARALRVILPRVERDVRAVCPGSTRLLKLRELRAQMSKLDDVMNNGGHDALVCRQLVQMYREDVRAELAKLEAEGRT